MTAPLLRVSGLRVGIGAANPVDGVDLDVQPGEVLGIVGESGSGKSLTLRAILRLLPSGARLSGQVIWQGQDMAALSAAGLRGVRGRGIALVFQEPMTALNPVLTVGLQITESLAAHLGLHGGAARRRAAELLDLVGIPDAARRLGSYPHEFSGGMRQRAMIAIALAAGPKLLLAILFISHDLRVVRHLAHRVAVMYLGRVVEAGPADQVFAAPLHPYTQALLRAAPTLDMRRLDAGEALRGELPSPLQAVAGCPFNPRCPAAFDRCRVEPPAMRVSAGHGGACHLAFAGSGQLDAA